MKFENLEAKAKDGTVKSGDVGIPETLAEVVTVLGEERLFKVGLQDYLKTMRRRIAEDAKPRRKKLTVYVDELTPDALAALEEQGLIK